MPQNPPDNPSPAAPSPEDYERFVRLFAEHNRRVFSYTLALLPDRTEAEEAFAETSVVLWREFARFEPGTDFAAWACAIAFNQVRTQRRKMRDDRLVFSDALIAKLSDQRIERADTIDRRTEALAACRQKLSEIDADLLERRYAGNASFADVADELGRPRNTVYKALQRIRRSLMECIDSTLNEGDA